MKTFKDQKKKENLQRAEVSHLQSIFFLTTRHSLFQRCLVQKRHNADSLASFKQPQLLK